MMQLRFLFVICLLCSFALCQDKPFYFSSYLGAPNALEIGKSVIIDNARQLVFVGGWTNGTGQFPVTSTALQSNNTMGSNAAFLSVFTLEGTLIYSTYILDNGFSSGINDMALVGTTLYVGGSAGVGLPTTPNAFQTDSQGEDDAFIAAFDTSNPLNLTVIYITYLGGSSGDYLRGITTLGLNVVCVTGQTFSTNFPLMNSLQTNMNQSDVFVSCLNTSGYLIFSTFWGGSADESSTSITSDGVSVLVVGGYTTSPNFPLVNPYRNTMQQSEGFITAFDISFFVVRFSTFFGGSAEDSITSVSYQPVVGITHFAGNTLSNDIKVRKPIQKNLKGGQDAVVGAFGSDGSLVYATYLGGSGTDSANGITTDANDGRVAIVGETNSADFLLANELYEYRGNGDAFLTVLTFDGQMMLSSFFGSNYSDGYNAAHFARPALAVVGYSRGPGFPVTESPYFSNGSVIVSFFNATNLLGSDEVSSGFVTGRTVAVGGVLVLLVILTCFGFVAVGLYRKLRTDPNATGLVGTTTVNNTGIAANAYSTSPANENRFQQLDEDKDDL